MTTTRRTNSTSMTSGFVSTTRLSKRIRCSPLRRKVCEAGAAFLLTVLFFVQTVRADAPTPVVPLIPSAAQQREELDRERTRVHLRRIRPAAFAMWGLTAALGISVLGAGVSALSLSRDFSRHSYVGATPPKDLVADGQHIFDVAIATDVIGIFAISAAVGAIVLSVQGYGPAARKVLP